MWISFGLEKPCVSSGNETWQWKIIVVVTTMHVLPIYVDRIFFVANPHRLVPVFFSYGKSPLKKM
jgi:hypothetical protein